MVEVKGAVEYYPLLRFQSHSLLDSAPKMRYDNDIHYTPAHRVGHNGLMTTFSPSVCPAPGPKSRMETENWQEVPVALSIRRGH